MKKNYERAQVRILELTSDTAFLGVSIWVEDDKVTVDPTTNVTGSDSEGNETDYFDLTLF